MASPQVPPATVRFGVFEADLRAGQLRRNGIKVRLQDLPFRALTLLLSRPAEVITREEFRQSLWPADVFVDFEQGISSAIMRLRDALGDSADNPIFIETIERRGYRWIGPVISAPSEADPGVRARNEIEEPSGSVSTQGGEGKALQIEKEGFTARYEIGFGTKPPKRMSHIAMWAFVAVLLLLGVAGLLVWKGQRPASAPISSIAILPFDNLSAPAFDDSFSDGLTDEVAASVSHLDGVRVAGRRSAYTYKGKRTDLREVGRQLDVEAVVEGSVQRSGERTHVTVELNRTRDGFTMWSQTYDGTTADWFQIESQIANSIARSLVRQVKPGVSPRAAPDPDAHAMYLQARYLWNERNYPGLLKSVDLLQQATVRDPNYALAWAGLADSLIAIGNVEEVNPAAYLPRARDAALKALQLDPTLAEAHAALGNVACHYDYDWPTAEREYKKALELNQSYPSAHQYYALGLMAHGRLAEAEAQLAIARRLDPLAYIVDVDLALVRKYQRNYDGIIAISKGILDRDPNFLLAYNMLTTGYYLERRWNEYLAADAKRPMDDVTRDLAKGRTTEAVKDLQATINKANAGLARPSSVVHDASRLGKRDLTLDWLEKSYANHDYWELFINVDPEFDSVRAEPRFHALVHKLGLE